MRNFDHNSGEYLDIDGARIYYEVAGNENSPALLVLHGGFGNMEDFNAMLLDLNKEFKVIGIDSRGQGKSTLGSKALTYEQIQKDVERVLEHLNIDTLSIIGFSDGGIVAYRLASLTPLNIEKLVSIGSSWHIKNTEPTRDMFLKITGESWRNKFPATYDAYQKLNPEPDFDFLAQSVIKMWLDSSSSGRPNEAVKNISCPLLIVRGDDDHLLSREAAVELSGLVKKSMLLNIPFAGHVAFEDQKEIFMIILNKFLKE
ncbi:MAG: alpha/beta fold hydrolase [bacterium]|uniref:Alpha/beta hydrolase n=1 Tax=Candidatus Acididesulfobacter diazotrophicus TaxID=2597226 RepID=A0A519BP13_9DELT|nr:MAG: alpha/beta hydrolase [Candidatus Acididesulfobacter diazotrophicus]